MEKDEFLKEVKKLSVTQKEIDECLLDAEKMQQRGITPDYKLYLEMLKIEIFSN